MNRMELLLKSFGILASVVACYKVFNELLYNRKTKLREEYEFVKTYFKDINENNLHKFVIEKGYLAISGKLLGAEEISYILKFNFPSNAINHIHHASKYIEYNKSDNKYEYRPQFSCKRKRLIWEFWYSITYFLFAFLAFLPIFFGSLFKMHFNVESVVLVTMFSVSFIILAVAQLGGYKKINSAKYILEEQKKNHLTSQLT